MRYLFMFAGCGVFAFFLVYGVRAYLLSRKSQNKE